MSALADNLRKRATEQRQAVSDVRNSASSQNAAFREKLLELSALIEDGERQADAQQLVGSLLESMPSDSKQNALAITIVGCTTANVFEALADIAESSEMLPFVNRVQEIRTKYRNLSKRLNQAAARGDWNEFDRIRDELARGEIRGSDGDRGAAKPTAENEGGQADSPVDGAG